MASGEQAAQRLQVSFFEGASAVDQFSPLVGENAEIYQRWLAADLAQEDALFAIGDLLEPQTGRSIASGDATPEPPERARVLLVDDEPLVLDMLEQVLCEAGFEVQTSLTAGEATALLELNRARDVSALVTDVNLGSGERSGWEVGQRARELAPRLPVIYVTGDSAHEWSAKGVSGSQLLMKPFVGRQVVEALRMAINERATNGPGG